jgi:hypothetical protein
VAKDSEQATNAAVTAAATIAHGMLGDQQPKSPLMIGVDVMNRLAVSI